MKIIFWNTEHLSPNALKIAEKAVRDKNRQRTTMLKQATRSHGPTRAVTRSLVGRSAPNLPGLSREERREVRALAFLKAAAAQAEKLRNKSELSLDLPISAPRVFYCEVITDHPDHQSPFPGGVAVDPNTLCYAHYSNGVSTAFTDCPTTGGPGWYGGPALAGRVPKSVTLGAPPVRFCFWHAPSGNNGAIVAQVYNGLNAAGQPFVLFGDLNAEPHVVTLQGVPPLSILNPGGPTRISGRCLDYAITNVPLRFPNGCRPLYTGVEGYSIKERTGSDHMIMSFCLT
jgi:hypothetical protein